MHTELVQVSTGKRVSLTPNCDQVFLDPNGRGSVEYARARKAIEADFKENFKMNQPLAKNLRRKSKHSVVETLKGKVSFKMVEDKKNPGKERKAYIVTFPDESIAYL